MATNPANRPPAARAARSLPAAGRRPAPTPSSARTILIVESEFYQKLAEVAGYRSWDEPALGRLPIVADFYAAIDALDFGEVLQREKRLVVQLDRREPPATRR